MVAVKGRSDLAISSLTQLGLTDRNGVVRITPNFRGKDLDVDPWGDAPADIQFMLADATITMTLVHIDRTVLDICLSESMAGAGAIPGGANGTVGTFPRAGSRMGNNTPRFSPNGTLNPSTGQVTTGNHYIGLNLSGPVSNKPWRFFFAYLAERPLETPIGVERSTFQLTWRAVPYTQDPWAGGTQGPGFGALGYALWDYNSDS